MTALEQHTLIGLGNPVERGRFGSEARVKDPMT